VYSNGVYTSSKYVLSDFVYCIGTDAQSSQIKVSKAVPLHAMEALGGRGDIAPTHSIPRH
jgi:hypothetical protein